MINTRIKLILLILVIGAKSQIGELKDVPAPTRSHNLCPDLYEECSTNSICKKNQECVIINNTAICDCKHGFATIPNGDDCGYKLKSGSTAGLLHILAPPLGILGGLAYLGRDNDAIISFFTKGWGLGAIVCIFIICVAYVYADEYVYNDIDNDVISKIKKLSCISIY